MDLTPEEQGQRMLEAVRGAITRALAGPLQRIAALELKLSAIAMVVARGPAKESELRGTEDHLQVQRDLIGRLDAVTARLASVEARKGLHYAGIWRAGVEVDENSLATHSGSLWLSRNRTSSRPGSDDSWQLIAKRGS